MSEAKILYYHKVRLIVVHASLTPKVLDIGREKLDRLNDSDKHPLAPSKRYHYYVRQDGTIETGVPTNQQACHCRCDDLAIGVVYIGGVDEYGEFADTRTTKQKASLFQLLDSLTRYFPNSVVCGADDLLDDGNTRPKGDPCYNVQREYYGQINNVIRLWNK